MEVGLSRTFLFYPKTQLKSMQMLTFYNFLSQSVTILIRRSVGGSFDESQEEMGESKML
jgi:hypothetical protein